METRAWEGTVRNAHRKRKREWEMGLLDTRSGAGAAGARDGKHAKRERGRGRATRRRARGRPEDDCRPSAPLRPDRPILRRGTRGTGTGQRLHKKGAGGSIWEMGVVKYEVRSKGSGGGFRGFAEGGRGRRRKVSFPLQLSSHMPRRGWDRRGTPSHLSNSGVEWEEDDVGVMALCLPREDGWSWIGTSARGNPALFAAPPCFPSSSSCFAAEFLSPACAREVADEGKG